MKPMVEGIPKREKQRFKLVLFKSSVGTRANRSIFVDLFLFLMLSLCAAFTALPLVFVISNALKPLDELYMFPPRFFVINPTLTNFVDLFYLMSNSWVPLSRYIFNTFFITIVGTIGLILLASAAAFALAKHPFPGRKMLFGIVVLALMFSPHVTAIPNFMIMSMFSWIDTYYAVIIPAFVLPIGLYLMKQFMEQIPDAMLEAAKIDGANEYRIFWSIVMPLVKPAWLTLVIFSFQALWANNTASFYIFSEEMKTLHYAVRQIMQGGVARAGASSAVVMLMMMVPIGIFILAQRNILQTMSTSGMKD